jgi:Ca2+-binding RTX toxin-like protein
MATISELAQMSDNVYNGTNFAVQNTVPGGPLLTGLSGNWTVFADSNSLNPTFWTQGYFGVAYYNKVTHEVVVANRGTELKKGPNTLVQNLLSDLALATNHESTVQYDAAIFAKEVAEKLVGDPSKGLPSTSFTSFIETGHSLGGTEAQAAIASLVADPQHLIPAAQVSGVLFNSPGIGKFPYNSAYNYNVVALYDQGDEINVAGGTHLGGPGNMVMLAAGPDTSKLVADAPLAISAGPIAAFGLLGVGLYDVLGPAHSIDTIVPYLAPGGGGSAIGSFNWTSSSSASSIMGSPVNPSLPSYLVNPSGDLVLTDPASHVSTTFALSSDGQSLTGTFSGGTSAIAQALSGLGVVSVPISELGENLTNIIGASALTESIIRIDGNSFGVTFVNGDSQNPLVGEQFGMTVANSNNAFAYALPGGTQTIQEYIDNGTGSTVGSVVVLSSNTTTQLVGGSLVGGQSDTWEDSLSNVYSFVPASPDSSNGVLTISDGLFGAGGDEIIINNFNLSAASGPTGYLGIFLPEAISLNASANAGGGLFSTSLVEGSNQSFTLSVNSPSAVAQTVTVTLTGANPSDFDVAVGDSIEQINPNKTFTVTLPAGETNVAFTLNDITADNGSTDIASGANLQLTASVENPDTIAGGTIQASPLTFSYIPTAWNTAANLQPTDTITGIANGGGPGITLYQSDSNNDYAATTDSNNEVNFNNSGNNSIAGNASINSILVGSGNNIIVGNGGTDEIVAGGGANEIYAGTKTSIQNAIASALTASPTGVQGDLISVLDGSNTVVSGNGNDIVLAGSGSDVIVLGPGRDTFWGGIDVTSASENWNVTGGLLNNATFYVEPYTNTLSQPYNGFSYTRNGGASSIASAANDTIFAGNGNDWIGLGNGNNYVELGSGSDTLVNGMGNDTIIAGSGSETILGGGGTEYIYGGSGTENISGGDGNNTIIGGSGHATIYSSAAGPNGSANFPNASAEQNYVTGGSGNDLIYGSPGQDTLIAGTGNATIVGGIGTENIVGGSGNDLLEGGAGNDTIVAGGSGLDSLYAGGSSTSTSMLYGGSGTDLLVGASGNNILQAGDGGTAGAATSVFASQSDSTSNTTIYGGLGIDFLEGGIGSTVIYGGDGGTAAAPTTELGLSGNTTIYGGLGTDIIQGGSGSNVLYAGDGGTASAVATVLGGTGVSTLYGGAGSALLDDASSGQDLLVSATANDTLVGVGSDTLVAGTGNDVLQANSGSVNIDVNAGFGNDSIFSLGGTENLSFGTGIAPTDFVANVEFDAQLNSYLVLSGDGGSVQIEGALTGSLGTVNFADYGAVPVATLLSDVLGGDQTIAYGASNLFVSLGNNESVAAAQGSDTVSSWGNSVTVTSASSNSLGHIYSTGTNASITSVGGTDTINSTGAGASIKGGTLADQITVSGANSIVTSGAGNDVITASGNSDTLVGGTGNSTYYVQNASTVIQVASGGGIDTVIASVSYTAPNNVATLTLTGSANITATGNASADKLTGGAGQDTLVAGAGISTLVGGSGNTTFVVNSASDVVQDTSTTTSNTIQSSVNYTLATHVNTLVLTGTSALVGTANSANDTLVSNSGIDTLVGGTGNDTFVLNNPSDVVQDSLGTATIVYQAATNFTLPANVNTLNLTGTLALQATGNAGNDSITANSGADTLSAGNGNDTLVSGAGIDSLVGGTGTDLFVVNNASDVVTVGSTHGNDTIQSSVSYTASANVANLTLIGNAPVSGTGNALANVLTAGGGTDTLTAGSGLATLVGGAGNDTFVVNSSSDVVQDATASTSNIVMASASYTLVTNVNALTLTGTAALTGTANAANDTLTSNTGADTLVGGSGNETFVINNSGVVIQDTSVTASNSALSSVNYSLPTNVNALTLTGTAALLGTSNAGNDLITANSGADSLVAVGNATLISGTGVDSLVGGTGNVLFLVNNAADTVNVGASHGSDTIQTASSYTLPTNVNTLILTGSANLTGVAITGNNSLLGNAGNDSLVAGSGRDTLIAGSGVDTLVATSGTDWFVINNASDVLQGITAAGDDQVYSSVSYTMAPNLFALTLTGTANLVATGNSTANSITGNLGNDTLTAGSGVATFYAGMGADLFVVNNIGDVVNDLNTKAAMDTIQSSVSYTLPSVVNVLALTGTANLTGTGNGNADLLIGNSGSDTLTALSGNDTLTAGGGLATLIGGNGNDTFVINSASDVVQDSQTGYNNILASSVSYSLPTNINTLVLAGSGNLTATANSGNDSLTGNAGTDTLVAGTGNDTLNAGAGLATLIGGAGADTFIVNNSSDVIQSASAATQNALFSSASFVLPTNVNNLTLTGIANISGTGNSAADTVTAGAGLDTLIAGTGSATLIGGAWNDTFVVNSASDVVQDTTTTANNTIQSSVNYTLVANVNSLVLSGTAALTGTANTANDTLTSNSGIDTLVGSTGNDTFVINNSGVVVQDTSTTAINTAQSSVNYSLAANVNALVLTGTAALTGTGNAGVDTLTANSGADTLFGGTGNDTFIVSGAADMVQDTSTTTTNTILASVSFTLPTNVNALTLTGTASLTATGNSAANVIKANSGNDTLIAGTGVATLVGSTGNDAFVVNSASDVVQDTSTTAINTLQSSVNYTLATNVNSLVLTGTSALVGTANSAADTLTSNSGVDTLVGGSGHDLFIINNSADVIQNVNANDTIESSVNYTLPAGVNNLVLIASGNITGTGNSASDTLTAGAGTDTLTAGTGVATLIGGTGNDTFVVNSASDVVQVTSTTTSNTVQSSVTYTLGANVDTLILTGTAALTATGNTDLSNVLTANTGNDSLVGTAFSNTLNGGTGSDKIYAGPEINVIYAGNGGTPSQPTYVYGNASGTNVTTESTIYGGSGSDVIDGGVGSDLLIAGSGANTLVALGADTLVAGSGTDYLVGSSTNLSQFDFNAGFGQSTINSSSLGENLNFGTGIEPTSFTVSATSAHALILTLGTESIVINQGLEPGTIPALTFADTGTESLAQLMQSDAPAVQTITGGGGSNIILVAGNSQNVAATASTNGVYIWGNSDSVSANLGETEFNVYGNNDTVSALAPFLYASGSGDVITINANGVGRTSTIAGANDTVSVYGGGSIQVNQSANVQFDSLGGSVSSEVNFTLPTNATALSLNSGFDGLVGTGNAGADNLAANADYDTLIGGAGSDLLTAYGNGDVLVGGSGADVYVLHSNTDTINYGTGNASLNEVFTYFSYTLGSGADSLNMTASNAVAQGNSGNDWISANGTNDSLIAGSGNDTLDATSNTAVDTLVAGTGNDTFEIATLSDIIANPSMTSSNTVELNLINGPTQYYTLPTNINSLIIEYGKVVATANSANDLMVAGTLDTLIAGSGLDTLDGSQNQYPSEGGNTLVAGTNNDTFIAGTAADTYDFNSGFKNDVITGTPTGAVIDFGTGILQSALTFTAVPEAFGTPPALVISGAGGNVTVEGGLLPGAISSIGFGDGTSTTIPQLFAPTGRSTITGSNGNLIFTTNASDTVTGGTGQDTVLAWGSGDALNAGSGGTAIYAGGASDQVTGGSGNDFLQALATGDSLTGGAGHDTLVGSNASATNYLVAGTGVDTLIGGAGGVDYFYINNASDVVVPQSTSRNYLYSTVGLTLPANFTVLDLEATGLTATGISGATLETSTGSDTLIAGSGAETLTSQSYLTAGYANTLVAGSGPDVLDMVGGDTADFNPGFGNTDVGYELVNGWPTTFQINFGTGITGSSLTATAASDSQGDALTISGPSGVMTLEGGLAGGFASQGEDYEFQFGSGGVLTLGQFFAQINVTTSTVAGGFGNLILEGNASTAVTGGTGDDTIYAAAANDTLNAGSGTQVLNGLEANDLLVGGSSNDTITGMGTGDTLVAGSAADTLVGGTGVNVEFVVNSSSDVIQLQTGPGSDTLSSSISYTLPTNVNSLLLTGTSALTGKANSSADTLASNTGLDTLVGSSGNDYFILNNASDVIQDTSTTASNTIQAAFSYSLPTHVNNLILTGTAALTGTGNAATDVLTSNTGVDTLNGGTGNDTFILNNASDVVQDASATNNTVQTGFSFTLPTNVNSLLLTGTANLVGVANNGTDSLTSNSGIDTLTGGSGNDTFVIANSNDVIQDTSTTATNSAQSSVSFSLASNVNSLTLTGTAALTGTANGGTDTLTSNSGVNTLVGGAGNDTFVINNSSDVIQDTSTTATNTAKSAVSYSLAANVNTLVLTGAVNINGTANSGNDSITANTGNDTLVAGSGADTLVAGTSGTDSLVGGSGNDSFFVNNTADIVTDTSTTASNVISSTVSYTLPTNVNALIFTGAAALKATANSGNDSLTANTGSDTLVAGSGADTLVAGTSGTDSLVGGSGNDTFFVNNTADKVTDTSSTASNTIFSTVSYTLPTDVNSLIFTGAAALKGTANSGNDSLTANTGSDTLVAAGSGNDTLVAGTTGTDSLVGGSGNDTFFVNNTADKVSDTSSTASNTLESSVTFTLPTDVNTLILTGTAALVGTGNAHTDSITANSGADTLTAGSAVATLIGGAGNDTFVINNANDVITDTSTTASNIISSTVSYTLPNHVNALIFTGTAALVATANSGNDSITANTGNDTLVAAGSGNDTLVAGTTGTDSLVGGSGNDTFFVNNTADKVSDTSSAASNTISSTVSYTLPTDVSYLTLTGTSALSGTGNTILDLIVGNTGNDTLTAGTGIAALEGGRTAGSDQIKASSNQAALIAGAGSSTLTGGAFKDFYAAGLVSDSITTGATSNVVSINKGDGATALQPTTSATNVLSLGAGIDTESLYFTKTGNNLILTDGVSGDSITFTNWYVGSADQNYTNLQVVEIASANYNSGGGDGLRNKALEDFNFTSLVAAYNTAGSPSNWALSTAMPSAQLSSSSTADYGGDLAYYFGLNGNLTGVDLSAVQSTLTNASFGTAAQTIDAFGGISGGGGLHLLVAPHTGAVGILTQVDSLPASALSRSITPKRGIEIPILNEAKSNGVTAGGNFTTRVRLNTAPAMASIEAPAMSAAMSVGATDSVDPILGMSITGLEARQIITRRLSSARDALVAASGIQPITPENSGLIPSRILMPRHLPQLRVDAPPALATIEVPARSEAMSANPFTPVTASAANRMITGLETRHSIGPEITTNSRGAHPKSYVDPVNVAWLTMHGALDEINQVPLGGAEASNDHAEMASDALVASTPLGRVRRATVDPGIHLPQAHQRLR